MSNRIITISREFGSGGRTIGKKVAERLGISCYDAELIDKIAEESGFGKDFVASKGEEFTKGSWLYNVFSTGRSLSGYSPQDELWLAEQKVIRDLAEKESCVIVGRCSDYILKDYDNVLKVFIHADPEKRAERIVKLYGETDDRPEKRLKQKDKRRVAYYEFYTDRPWGKVDYYDLALDTGTIPIEKCIDMICDLY